MTLTLSRPAIVLCFALLPLAAAEVPVAQSQRNYKGVIPGKSHQPPRRAAINRAKTKGSRLVTWPGFQPSGGGRFFLQLTESVTYETHASSNRFEVVINDTKTHAKNTRRWLETRFFNTPVVRSRVKRKGRKNISFVFNLRSNVTPRVRSEVGADGYHYLYVEFPAGNYAPTPPTPRRVTAPSSSKAPSQPSSKGSAPRLTNDEIRNMDNERPPGM